MMSEQIENEKYRDVLENLDESTNQLKSSCQLFDRSITQLGKFGKAVARVRSEQMDTTKEFFKKIKNCEDEMNENRKKFEARIVKAKEVFSKYTDKNGAIPEDDGLLVRFLSVVKQLEGIDKLKEHSPQVLAKIENDMATFKAHEEFLNETYYRLTLLSAAERVQSYVAKDDILYNLHSLPTFILMLLFGKNNSQHYCTTLLIILQKTLVLIEELHKSKISKPKSSKTKTPTLRSCVEESYSKSTSSAISMNNPLLTHGETEAPKEESAPVAKDSAMSLNCKQSPVPCKEKSIENVVQKNNKTGKQ